jgi:hypothetical protein
VNGYPDADAIWWMPLAGGYNEVTEDTEEWKSCRHRFCPTQGDLGMSQFNPTKAFAQLRAEIQSKKEAAKAVNRPRKVAWAAFARRRSAFHQLTNLFPQEGSGTLDVRKATDLMVEFAETLPTQELKAHVRFVRGRLASLAATRERAEDDILKEILLNLLLLSNARNHAKVAEIFDEVMRGDPDDVQTFRRYFVNRLVDKVVGGFPPLPDELKQPMEASEEFLELEAFGEQTTLVRDGTDVAGWGRKRLQFDALTQTIALDGTHHRIADPKAFAVYEAIANACPMPLTKATIRNQVTGCRGDKKIPQLMKVLPKQLRETVQSGPSGYWLKLEPLSNCSNRRRQEKGRI